MNTFKVIKETQEVSRVEIEYPLYLRSGLGSYHALLGGGMECYVNGETIHMHNSMASEGLFRDNPDFYTVIPPHEFAAVARLRLNDLTNIIQAIEEGGQA